MKELVVQHESSYIDVLSPSVAPMNAFRDTVMCGLFCKREEVAVGNGPIVSQCSVGLWVVV